MHSRFLSDSTITHDKWLSTEEYGIKSESMGAPGRYATCHLSDFAETWPV